MKSFLQLFLFGFVSVGGVVATSAAPLPPMKPVTIEGTIVEALWTPDTKHKERPGFSGTLGKDYVERAHFDVKLSAYNGVEPAEARRLNYLLGDTDAAKVPGRSPEFLRLKIDHKDAKALKKGMRLRVVDYHVAGDEGGTWAHFKQLVIDGKPDATNQTTSDAGATTGAEPDVRRWDFIILIDFSGFGIGRKIYLKRDAACIQQSFDRSMRERRHEFRVPAEELQAIEQLLVKHRFWDIKTNERRGYLDEGRPAIIVHLESGSSREVAKWSADKHPEFDPIYDRLRNLTRFADEKNKTYEGARNYDWRPSGFEISADAGATDATVNKKSPR